jgi:hypothetical protein
MRRLTLMLMLLLGACDGRGSTIEKACQIYDNGPSQARDNAVAWVATLNVRHDLTQQQNTGTFSAPQNSEYVIALTPNASVDLGDSREQLGAICGGRAEGYAVRLTVGQHPVSVTLAGARGSAVFVENQWRRRVSGGGGSDFDFD